MNAPPPRTAPPPVRRRWPFLYAAVTALALLALYAGVDELVLGRPTVGLRLSDFGVEAKLAFLGCAAAWAAFFPLGFHLANRLAGPARLADDLAAASRGGVFAVPFLVPTLLLAIRGNLLCIIPGLLLLLAIPVGLVEGRRRAAVLGIYPGLPVIGMMLTAPIAVPLATGVLRRLPVLMEAASVPAVPGPAFEPGQNAADLYRRAAALSAPAGLDRSREALELFRAAARLPACDFNAGARRIQCRRHGEDLGGEVGLFRLNLLEAEELRRQGRFQEAADRYGAGIGFLRHLGSQRNDPLPFLLGRMIHADELFEPLARFVGDPLVPAGSLAPLGDALRAARLDGKDLASAVESSYRLDQAARGVYLEHFLGHVYAPELAEPLRYGLERLLERDIDAARLAAMANKPEVLAEAEAERRVELRAVLRDGGGINLLKCHFDPEALPLCAYVMALPVKLDGAVSLFHMAEARLRLLETAVGLRLYLDRRGALPAGLAALVPRFLDAVPEDPFDGFQPLRYRADPDGSWTLHSLGPDRVDQRGEAPISFDLDHWSALPPGDLVVSGRR